jgi:hypothetical protein
VKANERATSKPATERATTKPATERAPIKPLKWATTKPAHEWATTKPAHEGATTKPAPEQAHKAAPEVPEPAIRPVATLPATCANQPVCATDDELDDLVADLEAKYSAARSLTTFVENFRGDEGDFHAEVKSIPHAAAPLLEQLRVTGAPVVLSTPPWSMQKKRVEEGPTPISQYENCVPLG